MPTMHTGETRQDVPTAALVRDAIDGARELISSEVALAKNELRTELGGLKKAIVSFAAAGIAATLGVAMLLIAFAIAIFPQPVAALVAGIVLLAIAGVISAVGWVSLPRKPLNHTTERIETDVHVLKEATT